jgi:hypothetical protein
MTFNASKYWPAIKWWELRRPLYNFVLFVVGAVTILIALLIGERFVAPGDDFIEPMGLLLGALAYGVMANVCYTFGWISEILWCGDDPLRAAVLRPKIFKIGLIFSVVLTLHPSVLIPMIWIYLNK